ncbi:MAG: hypothetical protein K2F57_00290 [Candidatus Gastranaerophilales bacterium]|nr:hypothetical protein [Candidatus Gastranaerophilales bacterium]
MDIALNQGLASDFTEKIRTLSNMCRISNIEKMLSDCFESMPESQGLHYIGEFNKNDVML